MNPRDKNPLLHAQKIWTSFGLPTTSLAHLHLSPLADLAINSHFRLGTAAQTSVGLSALAATRFHELRTGITQDVTVDPRHAIIAFSSEKYYLLDNKMPQVTLFDDLAGVYPTRDGYVRLHTNFPHHKRGLLQILECLPDRSSVSEALRQWGAAEFEQEAIRRGMCAVALRPFEALDLCSGGDGSGFIPLKITKIGDAPRRSATADVGFHGAFEGIRVVDMTRVLAGPVCGRTLAAHGADVLLVTSPNLPALPALDVDTSRGKRTTQLDLDADADVATFRRLLTDADVFLQAYRPGGLTSRGFSPSSLAQLRPGIICASLSAYPPDSAWGHVRGFDSLVQTMSGMNVAEAEAYARFVSANGGETTNLPPYRALPMQALDHAAGYFLAFGIATALCKTIEEGGSWLVEVSLYGVMKWIRELGTLDPQDAFGRGKPLPPRSFPPHSEITALHEDVKICQDRMRESASAATLTAVKHPAVLGKATKSPTFHFAPMKLDAHPAQWADMKGI